MAHDGSARRRAWVVALGAVLLLGLLAWWRLADEEPTAKADAADGREVRVEGIALGDPESEEDRGSGAAHLRSTPGASAPETLRGPVDVLVVGAHGTPLADVAVHLHESKGVAEIGGRWFRGMPRPAISTAITDNEGRVRFPDVPYDGSRTVMLQRVVRVLTPEGEVLEVVAFEEEEDDDASPVASAEPTPENTPPPSSEHEGEFSGFGSGDVEIFSVLDGFLTEAQWGATIRGPHVRLEAAVGLPFELQIVRAEDGRPDVDSSAKALGSLGGQEDLRRFPFEASDHLESHVLIVPGGDRRAPEPVEVGAWLSPEARQVVARVPTWASAWIPWPEDAPAMPTDAEIFRDLDVDSTSSFELPQPTTPDVLRFVQDATGLLRIDGLAAIPGARVDLFVQAHEDAALLRAVGVVGVDGRVALKVTPVPASLLEEGATGSISFDEFFGKPDVLDWGSSRSLGAMPHAAERGELHLTLLRPDGEPARGAQVTFHKETVLRADAQGRVRFTEVPPGTWRVDVVGAGASFRRRVTVEAGEILKPIWRADEGGRVRLRVVDADGAPVPFAGFEVEQPTGQPWCDVHQGVQRIDAYVDHQGTRLLHAVETGTVSLSAWSGGWTGHAEVEVQRGRTVDVEIVLKERDP